MKNYFT